MIGPSYCSPISVTDSAYNMILGGKRFRNYNKNADCLNEITNKPLCNIKPSFVITFLNSLLELTAQGVAWSAPYHLEVQLLITWQTYCFR